MIKKILYVGSKYEYSKKEKGSSLNKKAFYDNFIELGYDITPVWYDEDVDDLQIRLLQLADELKPDMIFFILQKQQIKKETLKTLQEKNNFLVNFFGDDQWRFDLYSKYYANYFNVCITTDKFSVDKYKAIGQKNIIRSQWASLKSKIKHIGVIYKYDVSFVGGANSYRKWFVYELEKRGIKVACFGDRWKNGRVSYSEMEEIFSTSKINLNISNSAQFDIRYLLSSPINILSTLKSRKNISQTKARNFEIPNQGGFELTEYVPSLEDYFELGKEIICYKDIDEVVMLIKYYLRHDNEREVIKKAGVERARRDHSFKNRVADFMIEIEGVYGK